MQTHELILAANQAATRQLIARVYVWLATTGLEILVWILGAILVARFIRWAADKYVKRLESQFDNSDLIVQTTSVGMHPFESSDPLPFYEFSGEELVYDIVYAPPETVLLKRAKRAGCRALNGERMLLEQAYLQFRIFTGFDYPEDCRDNRVF